MVKMVVMTVWIRRVQGGREKITKDQDVDEADGMNQGVYSKGGVLLHEYKNGL